MVGPPPIGGGVVQRSFEASIEKGNDKQHHKHHDKHDHKYHETCHDKRHDKHHDNPHDQHHDEAMLGSITTIKASIMINKILIGCFTFAENLEQIICNDSSLQP